MVAATTGLAINFKGLLLSFCVLSAQSLALDIDKMSLSVFAPRDCQRLDAFCKLPLEISYGGESTS